MKKNLIGSILLAICILCLTACSTFTINLPFGPGEYPVNKNMYTIQISNMSISLLIDKLVINNDYTAELYCTWKTTWSNGSYTYIYKASDNFNNNMYLKDNLGNHYSHTATTGAAYSGCTLSYTASDSGTFIFPAIDSNVTELTFYDDDQHKTITFKFQ